MKVVVTELFQDKFTKDYYEVGTEIEISDDNRVKDLVELGLVKVAESVEAPKKTTRKGKKEV